MTIPVKFFGVDEAAVAEHIDYETTWFEEAVMEMMAMRPLPEGYQFLIDGRTDNLLCCGPSLAFCVTKHAIRGDLHLTQYVPTLERLIACEDEAKPK